MPRRATEDEQQDFEFELEEDALPVRQRPVPEKATGRVVRIESLEPGKGAPRKRAELQNDLRIENEELKAQCEKMFNKMLQLQQEVSNKGGEGSEKSVDLSTIDAQIIRRRNEYLSQENQLLQKLNKDYSQKAAKKELKKIRTNELRRELI